MVNEPEGTKLSLIQAAGKLFAENGFDGTSVRSIADTAGANIAAINYHFGSKDNLYTEALRYVVNKHSDLGGYDPWGGEGHFDTPAAVAETIYGTVKERFSSYFSAKRPPWHSQLLMRSLLKPSEALRAIVEQTFRPDHEELKRLFRTADPSLTDEQAQLWAFSFSANITFYVLAEAPILMVMGKEEYDSAFLEAAADHAARAIIAAMGLPQPERDPRVAEPVAALKADEEHADER
jgi:TetR/AcrR family transcriptional regulator, regulator of cefoperazone and chloramphenicol sensitivity